MGHLFNPTSLFHCGTLTHNLTHLQLKPALAIFINEIYIIYLIENEQRDIIDIYTGYVFIFIPVFYYMQSSFEY